VRRFAAAFGLALSAAAAARGAAEPPPGRWLVIVLDAVPYTTMARLTGSGAAPLFTDFAPPVPLISTFPSTTSVALAGILGGEGLERSPGYEARFFDWQARRRRGGGPLSYFRVAFPWRRYFDWNRRGPMRSAVHALRPVHAGIAELRRAFTAFEAADEPIFRIYIADTDIAGHLAGPDGFDSLLVALDGELRALRRRLGPTLRIVVFSDHGLAGGEPLRNVLPATRRTLRGRGFHITGRLDGPDDVVLTPFGLVSSFEAYAPAERVPEVAAALGGMAGIDFCSRRDGDGWRLEAADGALRFERREDPTLAWRWEVVAGAPASGTATVLATAAPAGRWVDDDDLLAATAASDYPDPLYRVAGAFVGVDNPASVVCSVAAGHMYGARGTERSARWTKGRLRWTHGALRRDASLGFLMTDRASGGRPPALRYDRALGVAFDRVPARKDQP
jgi:hypothetical protein